VPSSPSLVRDTVSRPLLVVPLIVKLQASIKAQLKSLKVRFTNKNLANRILLFL
jgi:hypothetical protein